MQGTPRLIILSIYFFAAGVAVDFARWLMRNPRTTAAGIGGAVAYLAARFGLDLGPTASEWIIVITLIVVAKLAGDSHFDPDRRQ